MKAKYILTANVDKVLVKYFERSSLKCYHVDQVTIVNVP